jgi:hypothetical protein
MLKACFHKSSDKKELSERSELRLSLVMHPHLALARPQAGQHYPRYSRKTLSMNSVGFFVA